MLIIFIIVCLIIAFLVFLMFMVLKKTVRIVNSQAESYFVNELQSYDDLIQDKENKLQEIDEEIKNKEKGIKEEKQDSTNSVYAFDTNNTDMLNEAKYQNESILELNRKIDEPFVVNYEELIRDFLTLCDNSKNYEFCFNLRKKFNSSLIYDIKSLHPAEYEAYIKNILTNKECKVYEAFKVISTENNIENFINYLDQLVDLNNPKITILVGNKNENYNYLNENIETLVSDKIYRGIKIIYRNKIYDFSLSERNI